MSLERNWAEIRSQFPTLARKNYLNSCSLGLLSNRVKASLHRYIDSWTEYGASAWYGAWLSEIGAVREQFATLINASPEEIALLPNSVPTT